MHRRQLLVYGLIIPGFLLVFESSSFGGEKWGLKLDEKQYEMLKRCSENKDMTEWNDWRQRHRTEEVWLEGAELEGAYLKAAKLHSAHLEHANLAGADLEDADLASAHLENAYLKDARLEGANLNSAYLKRTMLWEAHLQDASLVGAYANHVSLFGAHLERVEFYDTDLEEANLRDAHLEGASLVEVRLRGANFTRAFVDGTTLFWRCKGDFPTDFRGIPLDNVRMDVKTRESLEYSIRRLNWEDWYEEHPLMQMPVRWFWWISDYGTSIPRVLFTFAISALYFAGLYCNFGISDPGFISGLYRRSQVNPFRLSRWRACLRALFFSFDTMVIFGSWNGKLRANSGSIWGRPLVAAQIVLGYIILAAFITRLAILFTARGPGG